MFFPPAPFFCHTLAVSATPRWQLLFVFFKPRPSLIYTLPIAFPRLCCASRASWKNLCVTDQAERGAARALREARGRRQEHSGDSLHAAARQRRGGRKLLWPYCCSVHATHPLENKNRAGMVGSYRHSWHGSGLYVRRGDGWGFTVWVHLPQSPYGAPEHRSAVTC